MVVTDKRQNKPVLRILLGGSVILACLYGFYITRAMDLYPELFLRPSQAVVETLPCKPAAVDGLQICLPDGLRAAPYAQGLYLSSFTRKISGSIHVYSRLPQEQAWRISLERSVFKGFLGDIAHADTLTLMKRVLVCRYNPFLMGIKAGLLPAWMRGNSSARIEVLQAGNGLIFSTPEQCQGLLFLDQRVVFIQLEGKDSKTLVPAMLHSITRS